MSTADIMTTGRRRRRAPITLALVVLVLAAAGFLVAYGTWFGARGRGETSAVDIQSIGRRRWRPRLIIALLLLLAAAAAVFLVYGALFGSDDSESAAFNTYRVTTATIRSSVTMSAAAEAVDNAVLSFGIGGRVKSVDVSLGDEVKAGQRLASLESDDLENALASADASLASARIRLQQIQSGATAADIADADKAVAAAQTGLDKALNDQQDLLDGASEAELAAADEAVKSAQSALATAQDNLRRLEEGPSDAEVSAAQSNVDTAQANLSSAQTAEQAAIGNVTDSRSALDGAAGIYCSTPGHLLVICADFVIPMTDAQVSKLSYSISPAADSEPDPELVWATNYLINANTTYENAVDTRDDAKVNVGAAQSALDAAQAALDDLVAPPDPSDIATAQAAVTAAEQSLTAAQLAQEELLRGPTASDVANAQGAVDSAQASLAAATAARNDLLDGPDQEDIDLQTQQVKLAELAVEKARQALEDATLTAPFDGTAAAINIHVGDVIAPNAPAITTLSPSALRVKLTLGETDLPAVSVGQVGLIIFDAIPGVAYPLKITSIGLAPDTQQGVVTYTALAEITRLNEGGEDVRPAPGMNGAAVVTTEEKANVLAVPSQAIRRRGNDQVVDVLVDGKPETRVIRTGNSDATNTEVTSGLEAGDLVILPGSARATTEEATPVGGEELPGGIR
jgi:multidrug efflux pump subunit AcrA (membrane-fusion protein)